MTAAPNTRLGSGPRLLLATLAVASLAALYISARAAMVDALSMKARWQITQWQEGKQPLPNTVELLKTRDELLAALAWMPDEAQLQENLGYLHGLRAVRAQATPELAQARLDETIAYYRRAIALRPMSAHGWANLALALHLRDSAADSRWAAASRR